MLELVDRSTTSDHVALEAVAQRVTRGDVTPIGAAAPAACGCSYALPTRTDGASVASSRYACVFEQYAVAELAGLGNLFIG